VPNRVEPIVVVKSLSSAVRFGSLTEIGLSWTICRALYNGSFTVPDWSGWVSATADISEPVQLSNIGYLTPIQLPITQVSTVHQCLLTSMQISEKLGQKFTFVTFDLAAAKLAFNVKFHNPEQFSNVTVHLGAFHTICAYMAALGRMMEGSGFEELVLDAGICASGSLDQMISGKHYNRALRVHQNMADALGRLMAKVFLEGMDVDASTLQKIEILANSPSAACADDVACDDSSVKLFTDFNAFISSIRGGAMTAQFWLLYYDSVWILLAFIKAIKLNDFSSYTKCIRAMCPLLFASDRLNYARYLPLYHEQLLNLDAEAYNLLNNNGITASRSNIPACRIPIDQTIEQTINRSAKSSGGIIGFSRNVNAYYRWCITRHKRASYLDAMCAELNMKQVPQTLHASMRTSERKNSEKEVTSLVETFNNFLNPFRIPCSGYSELFCLSSGRPAFESVAADLTSYIVKGDAAATKFIKERLVDKTVKFHDRLPKLSLKNFGSQAIQKSLKTTQLKTVTVKAERNLLGHLLMLSQSHNISLQKLFNYSLSPIPWSIATGDGCLAKTNKAQLMHVLEHEDSNTSDVTLPSEYISIIDGNALIRSLTSLPKSFGEFASALFNALPNVKQVHFVTDTSE